MNRLIPCLILAALGASFATAAQSPPPVEAPAPVATVQDAATAPIDADEATRIAEKDKAKLADPYCLKHTGSNIRPTGRQRCTAIGDAYTREDLDRTGANDIADALRRLDSSIR